MDGDVMANKFVDKVKKLFQRAPPPPNILIKAGAGRNRVRVNLTTCEIEVESFNSPLSEVYGIANQIAKNIGKGDGLDGKTVEERFKSVGVQ